MQLRAPCAQVQHLCSDLGLAELAIHLPTVQHLRLVLVGPTAGAQGWALIERPGLYS